MKYLRHIIFFILFFFFGFLAGLQFAYIAEAGKGQMLAGGAIVLGYGVMGAVIGIIVSVILYKIYKSKPKIIAFLNLMLAVLILGFFTFFYVKYQNREAQKKEQIGCLIKRNNPQIPSFIHEN
jgi:mannose/fructose/N-acetylgalactosamine-specific phosphotransferase system component IID